VLPYKDPEARLRVRKKSHLMMQERFFRIIAKAKEAGCMDCGNSDYRVLEFHHRPDERKSYVDMGMRHKSVELIMSEIAKCDLLCANCHLIRHYS
jgi:hypothetical protein